MNPQRRNCALRVGIGSAIGIIAGAIIGVSLGVNEQDFAMAAGIFFISGIGISCEIIGLIYGIGAAMGKIEGMPAWAKKMFSPIGWFAKRAFGGAVRLGTGQDSAIVDVLLGWLGLSFLLTFGIFIGIILACVDIRNCLQNRPVNVTSPKPITAARPVVTPNRTPARKPVPDNDDW